MKKLCSAVLAALACATLHGAGKPFELTGQIMMIADTTPRRLHVIAQDMPFGCCIWDMTELQTKCESGDIVKIQGFLDKPTSTLLREVTYPIANYATNITVLSHAELPKTVPATAQEIATLQGRICLVHTDGTVVSIVRDATNAVFTNFKGALAEQYVLQELLVSGFKPCYWTNDAGNAEVEFVIQGEKGVFPVEVKAGINTQAKSLKRDTTARRSKTFRYTPLVQPPECTQKRLKRFTAKSASGSRKFATKSVKRPPKFAMKSVDGANRHLIKYAAKMGLLCTSREKSTLSLKDGRRGRTESRS